MTATILLAVTVITAGLAALWTIRALRWMDRTSAAARRVYAIQQAKDGLMRDCLEAWVRGDRDALAVGLPALGDGHAAIMAAIAEWDEAINDRPARRWAR